jgi:TATA-binding protein-associated factor
MEEPLTKAFSGDLPAEAKDPEQAFGQEIVDAMSVIRTMTPTLDKALQSFVMDLLPLVIKALHSELSVFRYMAAKCLATICSVMTVEGMTALVEKVLPSISNPLDLNFRQGVTEAIYHLIAVMGDAILPYVIFLIVPVLGRMSDSDNEIRLIATTSFATLVKLVPLEAGIPDPPGLSEELLKGRDRERTFIAQLLDPKKVEQFQIPVAIKAELRSYQQEGVNWLHFLNKYHLHGILCDDMGLGKTLQTLCMVASDHHQRAEEFAKTQAPESRKLPSLIVCPPTLSGHWQQEIKTYAPFLSVTAYVGPPAERKAMKDKLNDTDIVITSYDVCRNDTEILEKYTWNYVVLDEGHLIKNPRAKITQAVKRLTSNHRLILTGTPIQNNVLELWSLFDFLMPGFLGAEKVFLDRFAKPIASSRGSRASSKEQEAGALAIEALHKQVLPFLLRRLKEEVLNDLPPKILQNYYCDLSDLQKKLFEDFNKKQGKKLQADAGRDDKDAKQHIFQALQYMRKLCNSPALVMKPGNNLYDDTQKILQKQGTTIEDVAHAPKLTALRDLLVDCGIGVEGGDSNDPLYQPIKPHRALIFCQMKEMLDMVQTQVLRDMLPSVSHLRLDGSVEANKRQDIVNKFNSDPSYDVLLLTTSVGGLGLNLTGADTVIFVEHDWNPQKDLQAMDRAHRIGQKKVVNVYRLITRGTLEEKILNLQRFKIDVASTVVNQQNAGLQTMDTDQILDLFNLGDSGPSLISDKPQNNLEGREEDMVDVETGDVRQPGKKAAWLDDLGEMWDSKQYEESFDLQDFMKTMG